MLEAPSGKTNDRAGRLRGPATYPRASRLRHGISRPCPHGSHDAPQQSDASALSGVAAWRRLSATAPPRATPTMASTTTAPGTTKRPKEPRVRSLRRLCKHLRRHFRSRGPFGQTELYGWGTTLASPLVHEIRSGTADSAQVVHRQSTIDAEIWSILHLERPVLGSAKDR